MAGAFSMSLRHLMAIPLSRSMQVRDGEKNIPFAITPLSFEVLGTVEDIEECARLSLLKCVDSRYYNTERAALFLYRTPRARIVVLR
jgi:hypothetical protein